MEELSGNTAYAGKISQVDAEQLSLLLLEAMVGSGAALQRALPRIRRTIRGTDLVFFQEKICAVVLPATPIAGAQVVARRMSALLVDVEYTMHVLYGAAAQSALSHLRCTPVAAVPVDAISIGNGIRGSGAPPLHDEARVVDAGLASLPHLAYLAQYPSLRLFHLFPYALACQYQCVPVGAERGVLTIATCQHLESAVIAHLQTEIRRAIFQVYCEMSIIEDVLRYWERMLPVTAGAEISRPSLLSV